MLQSELQSAHEGVEDSGVVLDDACWNELSGHVVVECFGAADGTVSSLIEVTRPLCHFLDAVMQASGT